MFENEPVQCILVCVWNSAQGTDPDVNFRNIGTFEHFMFLAGSNELQFFLLDLELMIMSQSLNQKLQCKSSNKRTVRHRSVLCLVYWHLHCRTHGK